MLNKKFKKAVSSVTMLATVVCLSGVSMLAPLSAKAAATIVDGDIIKSNATNSDGTPALSSLDVYIVKIVGNKKFKRLVLNPQVFASYGHLKWGNIKTVSQAEEDSFATSSLVRVDGSDKVYALTPAGDTGAKSWVNVTATQFIDEAGSDSDSIYTINSVDFGNYSAKGDITSVAELKAFYKDGSLPAGTTEGALKVSLAADTAESANIPLGVGTEFAKFNLTASDKGDVTVDSIKFTAGGLDDGDNIDDIAVYDEDGNRLNSSLRDVSGDEANVNIDNFVVEAGETETITVKAIITDDSDGNGTKDAGAEGVYALGIDSEEDINSDASSVSGSFPIEGNEMNAVQASGLASLKFEADGSSLSSVDLGDEAATLAKFKVTGSSADATIYKIALKKDSTLYTASNDAAENFELYADGKKVAEADEMTNKYVVFNIEDGVLVESGDTVKFAVKGDVVGGAGKDFAIALDNSIDVEAMGKKYPATVTDSYNAVKVDIEGGAVTIEKVDANPLKVKVDTDNVELGGFKITANSGEAVNLESLKLNIASTGDGSANAAFTELENVEIYDATDKQTYDLNYVTGGNATKAYQNTDIDINLESGETHELIVRGDTTAAANGNTYTVTLTSANLSLKEVEDDTVITDITPSTVTLKKIEVEASGISFTEKALSTPKYSVAGTEDVEAIRFTAKASASDVTISELQFADNGTATMNSSVVSGFKLYKGDGTLIKEVGTSSLSGEEVTFDDLDIKIAADATETFYVTLDLVSDSGNATKTLQLELSGYSAEDENDDVYDTTNDGATPDGDMTDGAVLSARVVTIVGVGSLAATIDNSLGETDNDIYAVAGTDTDKLAALKLKASNEDVEVTKIEVTVGGLAAADVQKVFSNLKLVDEAGTTIATAEDLSGNTIIFDDFTYVAGTTEKYLYLKGTLNKIGDGEVGILNESDITFAFTGIEANGASSGTDLTNDGDGNAEAGEIIYDATPAASTTATSKQLGVLASKISSVELVSSYNGTSVASQISGTGEYNVAIIKVTTDASSNTTSTGNAVKTLLQQIKLEVNKNASTVLGGVTLQKIGGSGSAISGTEGGNAFDAATSLGWVTFDTTVAGFATDDEIAASSTSYYVVKADIDTLEGSLGNDWIKVDLDLLNGTATSNDAAGANFSWKDNSDAAAKQPLRLEGISNIDGTKVNEQS